MNTLKQAMQDAGILGAGGAGFPSYAKLAEGADLLVINGAECEPLLYTDYYILREELPKVVEGASIVLERTGMKKALLSIKHHTAERLGLFDGEDLGMGVFVRVLPDVYPMGDEINLIYEASGRLVPPGALPIAVGVIVYNVETLLHVREAVREGKKPTEKWITIGGNIENPVVCRAAVGTRTSELFKIHGITVPDGHTVLDGGPAMGKVVNPATACVTRTTKSYLILPDGIPAIQSKLLNLDRQVKRASSACCQCTRCTDLCPRALLGYPLEPHRMVRTSLSVVEENPEAFTEAMLCCGCGICEIAACCQSISPRIVISRMKEILGKHRLRFTAKKDYAVDPQRAYRMLPSDRWMEMLGVKKFDRLPPLSDGVYRPTRVTLTMKGHIGAPSVPAVKVGDSVKIGDKIADAAEGLSLPQFAPISGKVSFADGEKIIIEE